MKDLAAPPIASSDGNGVEAATAAAGEEAAAGLGGDVVRHGGSAEPRDGSWPGRGEPTGPDMEIPKITVSPVYPRLCGCGFPLDYTQAELCDFCEAKAALTKAHEHQISVLLAKADRS